MTAGTAGAAGAARRGGSADHGVLPACSFEPLQWVGLPGWLPRSARGPTGSVVRAFKRELGCRCVFWRGCSPGGGKEVDHGRAFSWGCGGRPSAGVVPASGGYGDGDGAAEPGAGGAGDGAGARGRGAGGGAVRLLPAGAFPDAVGWSRL